MVRGLIDLLVREVDSDHAPSGADLKGDLAGSSEEMHVRLESLDLDAMSRMWEALDHSYQLCLSYEISVVPIDSALQPTTPGPVDVVMPTYALVTSAEEP